MHHAIRKTAGLKFWEDMSADERRSETMEAVKNDLKIANKEMAGLDAEDKDKVNYYLDCALDPTDPMSPLYKLLLKNMGATFKNNGIQLPKHLDTHIK